MVQPVENTIRKGGMTFTVEAALGDRYNVLLVYTLSRDDGQPLTMDTDIVDWLCYDNYSIKEAPDAFAVGSGFALDDDPSDGTLQFASVSYAYDFDTRQRIPMAGQTLVYQSFDVFYQTPNPDFVPYGDESKYDTTYVFSSETDLEIPLVYEDTTVCYAAGQVTEKGGIRTEINGIYLSPLGCMLDVVWSFQTDELAEPYSTSFQLKLKDGTVWDGTDNRLSNGYIDAGPVMKTQTIATQKNWVFDRIIPTEDVVAIIYDGVEIRSSALTEKTQGALFSAPCAFPCAFAGAFRTVRPPRALFPRACGRGAPACPAPAGRQAPAAPWCPSPSA